MRQSVIEMKSVVDYVLNLCSTITWSRRTCIVGSAQLTQLLKNHSRRSSIDWSANSFDAHLWPYKVDSGETNSECASTKMFGKGSTAYAYLTSGNNRETGCVLPEEFRSVIQILPTNYRCPRLWCTQKFLRLLKLRLHHVVGEKGASTNTMNLFTGFLYSICS